MPDGERGEQVEHVVIHKRADRYTPFPSLDLLPDGRLAIGLWTTPWAEHYGLGEWLVRTSSDGGRTWVADADPALPFNWPGSSLRERFDRLCVVLPDGTWLATGTVGWEVWPAARRPEAERRRLAVLAHPADPSGAQQIVVGSHRLFVQRSPDRGRTWERREWTVPEAAVTIGDCHTNWLARQ